MMVVSNSGPLMALGKLGQVDLLPQLYGQVSLPTAVYTEVVTRGNEQGAPDALVVQNALQRGQLVVVEVQDTELLPEIATTPLHTGEKQTLHLALREGADAVLLDDLQAREEAQARGLTVKGTLGVVVQAYRASILPFDEVQVIIETIIARDDIWIAAGLCRRVLERLQIPRT